MIESASLVGDGWADPNTEHQSDFLDSFDSGADASDSSCGSGCGD